jgi:hypothetical protein
MWMLSDYLAVQYQTRFESFILANAVVCPLVSACWSAMSSVVVHDLNRSTQGTLVRWALSVVRHTTSLPSAAGIGYEVHLSCRLCLSRAPLSPILACISDSAQADITDFSAE